MAKQEFSRRNGILYVLLLAALVVGLRMLIESLIPRVYQLFNLNFSDFLFDLLAHWPMTLLMVLADFFLVRLLVHRYAYGRHTLSRTLAEIAGILGVSALATLLLRLYQLGSLPAHSAFFDQLFLFTLFLGILFNTLVTTIIDLVSYYIWNHKTQLATEVNRRDRVTYQYALLKSQLNPHFLFNSLNVLDYLIYTDRDRASGYVKKLASVYRYLLNMESRSTVQVEEEMQFVRQYVDLLRERFSGGFECEMKVPGKLMNRRVVPCSLQLLVENAAKHNAISPEKPLRVSITATEDQLVVTNNLQEKIKLEDVEPGRGHGLDNIRRQYKLLCDAPIYVNRTETLFEVRIPLIA